MTSAEGSAGANPGPWAREWDALLRGLTGGFLIGIPLLYTMETWQLGARLSVTRMALFLIVAYLLNLAFVFFAGFHQEDAGSSRPFGDALEATAIAIVASAATLALLGQLWPDEPLQVILGRIVVNTLPVSLGVSIANHVLGGDDPGANGGNGEGERDDGGHALLRDIAATMAGALLFSLNIAVTDEVGILAGATPIWFLPVIIVASMVIAYLIVFEAGFGGQKERITSTGPFQRPLTETVLSYVVSLLIAAGLLALFQQFNQPTDPDWTATYAKIIILGLPAAVGGAAGRLAA